MNKSLISLILLCTLSLSNGITQELGFSGPVSQALANIRALDKSAWAVFNNSATLANQQYIAFGASYQMRFNIEELSSRSLIAIVPNKHGVFSGAVLQSGYKKSLLSRYAIAYSRTFAKSTAAFVQYNYLTHHIEGTERSDGFFSSTGLIQSVSKNIQFGVLIINPEQSAITYGGTAYSLPTLFNIGLQWSDNNWAQVFTEIEKELDKKPVYKTAVELNFNHQFFIRFGIKGQPVEFSFGTGYSFSNLSIDAGFLYHQQLGLSSGIGIIYSFKQLKK